jgi:hypothetical protein
MRSGGFRSLALVIAVSGALSGLAACDQVGKAVTLPWVEDAKPTTGPATPASDATAAPVDVAQGPVIPPQTNPSTVPNPNANPGAPADGTPFGEIPENPNVPISDNNRPVDQDGQPVTLPPPPTEPVGGPSPAPSSEPSPSPSASGAPTPAPTASAPAPSSTASAPAPTPTASAPAPSPTATASGPAPSPTQTASASPSPSPTASATPAAFFYFRPGALEPGSGVGANDSTVMVPNMVFPIRIAPTFAQSQVYRYGGSVKGGDQCDTRNFIAPWRDNYCERRSVTATTPWCPQAGVHLGQDLRVGTPEGCRAEKSTAAAQRTRYEIVAVEDGVISNVGSFSINLRSNSGGRIYRYLHLNMRQLKVALGQTVKAGDLLGYVSNDFGGTPTTLHLHFEIKINTAEHGWQYAPPYSSLLAAYKRRLGTQGEQVADTFVVARSPR